MNGKTWTQAFCWAFNHADNNQIFLVTYRWIHILSAAAFIGLLLFLNLVLTRKSKDVKHGVGRDLLRRVFQWWYGAALLFLFSGLNLIHMLYNFPSGNYFGGDKGLWMAMGASLGAFFWCMVWLWIRPAQNRHFKSWQSDDTTKELLAPRSAMGIRLLTILTAPLLMGMVVGGHGLTLFSWGWRDVSISFIVGCLPVVAIYAWTSRKSKKI